MSSGAQYVRCQSRLSDDPREKPRKIFALLPVGHLKHGTFGMKMLNHTQGWDIKRALAVVAGRRRPRSAAPLLLSRAPGVFLSARSPRRRLVEGTGVLPEWDVSWGSSISSWRHKFRGVGGQKQRDGTDGRRAGTPPPPAGTRVTGEKRRATRRPSTRARAVPGGPEMPFLPLRWPSRGAAGPSAAGSHPAAGGERCRAGPAEPRCGTVPCPTVPCRAVPCRSAPLLPPAAPPPPLPPRSHRRSGASYSSAPRG